MNTTTEKCPKLIPVPPKHIKTFNFARKPKKRRFLPWVARVIISWPDLRRRKAKLVRTNMEALDGKPYLLLINHASRVDLNMMYKATDPAPLVNVMTLEGFRDFTLPLMDLLGVVGKRKFIQDLRLIRNIKYTINDLKTIFVLFPESRYSLDGCTSYLPPSLGQLVRMLKVPVAVMTLHGNFVTQPQWNKKNKYSYVEGEIRPIVLPEEATTLSSDEINDRIAEAFVYDDYAWQYENKIVIDDSGRADGLHSLLYKCARCGTEHKMNSGGCELWCEECGARWEQDVYGRLHATDGGETVYEHIPDWTAWERECVRREVRDGTYYFEDNDVRIETLPSWTKFHKHGHGRVIQTVEGTRVEVDSYYGGESTVLFRPARDLDSMHIEYDYLGWGDCIDISVPEDSFWCYLSKRDAITKIAFATEEIYKLASENEVRTPRRKKSSSPDTEPSEQKSSESTEN